MAELEVKPDEAGRYAIPYGAVTGRSDTLTRIQEAAIELIGFMRAGPGLYSTASPGPERRGKGVECAALMQHQRAPDRGDAQPTSATMYLRAWPRTRR